MLLIFGFTTSSQAQPNANSKIKIITSGIERSLSTKGHASEGVLIKSKVGNTIHFFRYDSIGGHSNTGHIVKRISYDKGLN